VRHITLTDFPESWQQERPVERSHDSRTYGRRFMLRLDQPSRIKLQALIRHFDVAQATMVRQLIAQAKPQDFPKSWHMRAAERRAQQSGNRGTDADGGSKP
jgi:hypothetical protein